MLATRAGFTNTLTYVGPQDPRGRPANCGTNRVNCRYMMSSINIRQQFML